MASGFSLGVLKFQKDITKNATPQYKVDPYGYLAMLKVAMSNPDIGYDSGDGHRKTVKVKRKVRLHQGAVRTSRDCDNAVTFPYVEDTLTVNGYCEVAIALADDTVAQFDSYASGKVNLNGTGTRVMWEFMDSVQTGANAVLQCVDDYLVDKAVSAIGVNAATSSAAHKVINIELNTTNNNLSTGPTEIFSDLKKNSFLSPGTPVVVGAGLFYNYMVQQPAKSFDQSGVNTRILTNAWDFWYDMNVADEFGVGGTNDIIVYEKDAVQIIEYMVNRGFKAGELGNSIFGILTLPMIVGEQLVPVQFDYQLRYLDCPTVITTNGYASTEFDRGWIIIISKSFDLYTIPADAYHGTDRLTGNRGSLRYRITNA